MHWSALRSSVAYHRTTGPLTSAEIACDIEMNCRRIRTVATLLFPVPFLVGILAIVSAFLNNDADFVFGNFVSVDAALMDRGPPHPTRGRPVYFPTFRLPDGEILEIERPMLATELPPADQPIRLRCSINKPGNCKTPATPMLDPVFYGIAVVWSLLAAGFAWLMWGPFLRSWWSRSKARTETGSSTQFSKTE